MKTDTGWKPAVVTPDSTGTSPTTAGLEEAIDLIGVDGLLTDSKALIFRGFGLGRDELDAVLDRLLPNRIAYVHGNSPRSKVGRNLYTSTEYPESLPISLHSELSYLASWPSRLLFYCEVQPDSGGATPVVDAAAWLAALDPEVRTGFGKGVRYSQNLHSGLGLGKSWQDTFETTDRDEVEAYLEGADVTWSWCSDGDLRVVHDRAATAVHPVTGAEVWFNQVDQWHIAGLGSEAGSALARLLPEEELPTSACFGDGSPIPDEYITHVREAAWALAVDVSWGQGELLLIDNMLVGHGRRPFAGQRSILVAMA